MVAIFACAAKIGAGADVAEELRPKEEASSAPIAADGPAPIPAPAAPPEPPGWTTLDHVLVTEDGPAPVRVLPPSTPPQERATPPAVLTMLHGMQSSPTRTCDRIAPAARRGLLVVCPTGNVALGDDVADWAGDGADKARHLDGALDAALVPLGLRPQANRGDVLVGFSRGAFVARDVVYERGDRWRGLVLIGAALVPDAERLRASGIRRVVLASGDFDGARSTMVAARAKLCAAGMPARFVSLGPVWHALPADTVDRLGEALDWVRGEGDGEAPGCVETRGA
jgi:predicted esterase